MGIIHCDIKPDNVLIASNGTLVLADYGLSMDVGNQVDYSASYQDFRGTPNWAAPEVIRDYQISAKSDIWSLGIIFLELLLRSDGTYFDQPNIEEMRAAICEEDFSFHAFSREDKFRRLRGIKNMDARRLLSQMLAKDVNTRKTPEELLRNGYFKGIEVQDIRNGTISAEYFPEIQHIFRREDEPHFILPVEPAYPNPEPALPNQFYRGDPHQDPHTYELIQR